MNTVFTNDSHYLSARDDLLAVNLALFRKLQYLMMMPKNYLLGRSNKD